MDSKSHVHFAKFSKDAIVGALRKDDYRIQTLIFELVKSEPFRMRRGTEGDNP